MTRKQFTFYESFYRAIRRIPHKGARADVYDAICAYALEGKVPDWQGFSNASLMVLELVLPHLDAGKRKSEQALACAPARENAPSPPFPGRAGKDKVKENNKNEVKTEFKGDGDLCLCDKSMEDFALFWEAYPRKAGREQAKEVFLRTSVPIRVLLDALTLQKRSVQWTVNGGRYIPYPATWLREKRWDDQLAPGVPMGASGVLGKEEQEAIRRIMAGK